MRIGLIDQNAVTLRQYVHPDGSWNFDFAGDYERPSRVFQYGHSLPGGQIIRLSGFNFTHILAQFRCDIGQTEAGKDLGFIFTLDQGSGLRVRS